VDGAGAVYIADTFNNRAVEVTAAGAASVLSVPELSGGTTNYGCSSTGLCNPEGAAVDGAGDVYIADIFNNRVVEVVQAQAAPLTFAATDVGSTSSTGTQTVEVQNIGNQPLDITALAYPVDFPESGGDTNACTDSTRLSAGGQCDLPIEFAPQNVGAPLTEDVTLTDNSLNAVAPNNVQQIVVRGTGAGTALAIASNSSTNFTVGAAGTFMVTATGVPKPAFSETGALPSGVTFTDNGNGTATLAGTPAAGSEATYPITITASNGITPNATQSFTLTMNQVPANRGTTPQSATVNTAFATPLAVTVKDAGNNPMPNVTVVFVAPSSGASGTFSNGADTTAATTNSSGDAGSGTFTANATAGGPYTVTAAAAGLTSVNFSLTNVGTQVFVLTIAANNSAYGAFTPASGGSYTPGTIVNITATPNSGYYFTGWTGSADINSESSASTTITMNGLESIVANFAPIPGYVVNTTADDSPAPSATGCTANPEGSCTLRDALLAAANAGAGNITFNPTVFATAQTIQPTSGLTAQGNIAITGPTRGSGTGLSNLVTLNGTKASDSILTINSGSTVSIADLNFTNGSSAAGGAIWSYGMLMVTNSTFAANSAPKGGAIAVYAGTATLTNSTFSENS
jgi:hypothetical protein